MPELKTDPPAAVMLRELARLGPDHGTLFSEALAQAEPAAARLRPGEGFVGLVGCGDSHYAGQAVAGPFRTLAGLRAGAVRPRDVLAGRVRDLSLLVAISASGETPAVRACLAYARDVGIPAVLVTCKPDSSCASLVDAWMVMRLPDKEPSPGIRSFQANLLALLALALRLGRVAGTLPDAQYRRLCDDVYAVDAAINATWEWTAQQAPLVAAITAPFKTTLLLGVEDTRPSLSFAAAKRMEASGLLALSEDLEEFWHLQRFVTEPVAAIVIMAPPVNQREALRAAAIGKGLGRTVIAVSDADGVEGFKEHADGVLSIAPPSNTMFRFLVDTIPLVAVASHEALELGRAPFRTDRPDLMAGLRDYLDQAGLAPS